MVKMTRLSLCLLLVCVSARLATCADCGPQVLQNCAQPLLIWTSDDAKFQAPHNMDEAKQHCEVFKQSTRCIRGYVNDCTPKVIRQMSRVAMGSMKKEVERVCSPQGLQSFIEHGDCAESFFNEGRVCYKQLIRDLYRIEKADRPQLIAGICCYLTKFHDCFQDHVADNCRDEAAEFFKQEGGRFIEEMIEMMCPSTSRWGQATCVELNATLPEPVIPPDGKASLMPLLFSMMETLSDSS